MPFQLFSQPLLLCLVFLPLSPSMGRLWSVVVLAVVLGFLVEVEGVAYSNVCWRGRWQQGLLVILVHVCQGGIAVAAKEAIDAASAAAMQCFAHLCFRWFLSWG
ncbi:hypothetical protein U1Q18_030771 [Sarracenia purpurea var. burkii]